MTARAQERLRDAVAAMQRRDPRAARAIIEEVIAAGEIVPPWILLAQACRLQGDEAAERAALDKLLEADQANIRGLVMKGDWYVRAGDKRAARSFYKLALDAAPHAPSLSPSLVAELQRIEEFIREVDREYLGHLEDRLASAGFSSAGAGGRTRQALDILLGRKRPYFQEPTTFFFPGLPQVQFYERSDFPWVEALEAAAPAMREELDALLVHHSGDFRPYVEAREDRPYNRHDKMLDNPEWSALYLWRDGELVEENAALCPRTLEALREAPIPTVRTRSPMVLFSQLRPGAHIPPHTGMYNTRLICHIPLIVPPNCRLRVGNDTRTVEQGKALIFDDSIEHEAWNDSDQTRIILLFEVWRPELTAEEREALTTIFEAINDFGEGSEEASALAHA